MDNRWYLLFCVCYPFLHIVLGLIAAGFYNASAQIDGFLVGERERRVILGTILLFSILFGPAALVVSFFVTGFWMDGFSYRISRKSR